MRLIVADVRSTSTDGIAAGHYFTVAQNYLDLFGAEMDVRIAGGPVYGDRFGNKLIRLPHDYIVAVRRCATNAPCSRTCARCFGKRRMT